MKPVLFLCLVAFSASPGFAQDAAAPVASTVSVSIEDCRLLLKRQVAHTPGADVAYQAGVDAHGNAVAPADLEPASDAFKLPDEIIIDFGLDFAGRYGISGSGLHTATADLFTIKYDLAMGALTVNGKPLKTDDSRAIAKACAMMLEGNAAAQPK